MCQTPNRLITGDIVACHKCWQCRENRINDWVGRCIAESKTATACHSITLTYGRDEDGNKHHARSSVLTYSDVQKYWKRLRKNGYPCRYFVVGEYGGQKGRTHWHAIVFWQGEVPPHKLNKRFNGAHWHQGFSHWENPSYKSLRYVCKYIQKDQGEYERQGHLAMSKKPPLGDAWFRALAHAHAQQGIAPRDRFYRHNEAKKQNGRPHEFYMRGVTFDNFIQEYVWEWRRLNPTKWWYPTSEIIEEWEDAKERRGNYKMIGPRNGERLEEMTKSDIEFDREAFDRKHREYYFGVKNFGFYNEDWKPDGEKTWQQFCEEYDARNLPEGIAALYDD